jgi:predicted CopG family antitoxin
VAASRESAAELDAGIPAALSRTVAPGFGFSALVGFAAKDQSWSCLATVSVYFLCMAFVTLTITTEAHRRLKNLKAPGDSFSEVILRELPEPCQTAGEVLDRLDTIEVPKANHRLRAAMLAGRGRRSPRE